MRLIFIRFLLVFCVLFNLKGYAADYNWAGSISADWSVPGNWRIGAATPTTIPTATDNVFIGSSTTNIIGSGANAGQSGTSFISQPSLNTGTTVSCASVTFGVAKAATLTVNGTLNISGALTQLGNGGVGSVTGTITGTGTANCATLNAGSSVFLELSAGINNIVLVSTLANLNVSGAATVTSTSFGIVILGVGINNATFSLRGGTTTIGGQITTTAVVGGILSVVSSTPRFSVDAVTGTSTSPTLKLTNTAAINTASIDRSIDFYNNTGGTGAATVEYAGATAQTVYTNGTITALDTSGTVYQNIAFSSAGQKNIQAGRLTISGNWASNGGKVNAVANNPSVVFNSTSAQTLVDNGSDVVSTVANGVVFKNLLFQGTGTKTITTGKFAVEATGIMYVGSGTVPVVVGASGNLTLNSGTASSASVAAIPANSTVTGNVSVQRMLVGGTGKAANGAYTARGYRMLSSPVQIGTSKLYALNYIGLTALTGGSGTGFTVNNSNPTIYLYREDVTPSNTTFNSGKHKGILNINGNLVDVSGGPPGFSVPIGNGYIFYFVGNTSNPATKASATPTTGPENTIITATGSLNQQNVLVSLWYTPAGATGVTTGKLSFNSALGTSAGYNMVGNPYAATLDLNAVGTGNNGTLGINQSVYVLDNINPGQQYIAYNTSTGVGSSPKATRYITSGQGFIVKAKAANSTLTFQESYKAPASQPATLLMGIPVVSRAPVTGFYVKMERDSLIADYCGIYFKYSSSANFDDEDAKDLDGTSSQIYMSSYTADGVRTAINHMPDYLNGSRIRLFINSSADGIHKLRLEDVRNIDTLYNIWLKDKYKKDSLDIRRYGTYNFNVVRSDTATYGGHRFELVIRRKPLPPYQLIDFTATKTTEGIKLNWKTYNEGNFTGFTLEKLQASTGQYVPLSNQQSSSKTNYSYTDVKPEKGINTYRLQQNDIDSKITWSKPVSLSVADDPTLTIKSSLISVYPNPAAAMINVSVNPQTPANGYTAKIYNYTGAIVSRQKVNGNSWTQDVTQLQPGTYIIELNKANGELVGRSKFIKR